jgi:hypothetical protein
MDKRKVIEKKLKEAFEKLSKRFEIPEKDVRIAIICKDSDAIRYAVYDKGKGIAEIGLSDVVDMGMFSLLVNEDDVRDGILNKFYLFSIPIDADMGELRVFIAPVENGSPQGFLYRQNQLLNKKGFKIASLF